MTARRRLGYVLLLIVVAGLAGPIAEAAVYPNDPLYRNQWHLRRIGAPTAWRISKGKGITIAIVDTGVARHPDLLKNLSRAQYDAITGTTDGRDACPYSEPHRARICHGTSVAGAAAAVTNNRRGVAGVAPDARIMAIRVSSSQITIGGAAVASGVMWAVDHGAKVINLSLGATIGPLPSPEAWNLAILYATLKGALVVAAAGNSGVPFCSDPGENPAVLCVGASDSQDHTTDFSNYGVRLDVVAPGIDIWVPAIRSPRLVNGFYGPYTGTSFSAPIVAGVGALLMALGASNVDAAMTIRQTAKDFGTPGYDATYGFGRVDAAAAVNIWKQGLLGI